MRRLLIIFLMIVAAGCGRENDRMIPGYVEADTLYMAAQESGPLAELDVEEGEAVAASDLLFRLDAAKANFALARAEAAEKAARSRVEDAGALDQAVAEAEAAFENAAKNFVRSKELVETNVATKARLDNDRAALETSRARLAMAKSEREAASSEWAGAIAEVDLARQRVEDLSVYAPSAGSVERVYRRRGEIVAAGEPVIALLPPENVKIRFFAPEASLPALAPGGAVSFRCDGCASAQSARITFIAKEPQFAPPVIYSLDEREKLVFLVEARPEDPASLRPGMPVSVSLP